MDFCYIKETPYNENNTEVHYLRVLLLNTAIIGIFKQLATYINRVQYTVVKAISF